MDVSTKINIRNLQVRLLEIVDYVDDLCQKNNIPYFLIGGSAIGAVRHKGFIPWDDDFDIAMMADDYARFMEVCDNQLDINRFFFQKERSKGWPLYFSKIKMNNTIFREEDMLPDTHLGIFIDIFRLDNIADNEVAAKWQYFCGKILIAQSLDERGYKKASVCKQFVMRLSRVVSAERLRRYLLNRVCKYNEISTKRVASVFGKSKYKTALIPREYFGKGKRVEFEGRMLPVPEDVHNYLTILFGNYMELPPEGKRVSHNPVELKL